LKHDPSQREKKHNICTQKSVLKIGIGFKLERNPTESLALMAIQERRRKSLAMLLYKVWKGSAFFPPLEIQIEVQHEGKHNLKNTDASAARHLALMK